MAFHISSLACLAPALLACSAIAADSPPQRSESASYTALLRPPIQARDASGKAIEVIEVEEAIRGDDAAALFGHLRGRCMLLRTRAPRQEIARTCVYSDANGDQLTVEDAPSGGEHIDGYGVRRGRFVAGTGKFHELTGESASYPVTIGVPPGPAGTMASGRVEFRYLEVRK